MEFTSRQLRAFHLVAQHRSFARAAGALFVTPSRLSVLIRELERQLGFRLFDRTTRHVGLTAQGGDLLAVTQPAVRTLDACDAQYRASRSRKEQVHLDRDDTLDRREYFARGKSGSFVSTGPIYTSGYLMAA